jgi:alpha-tubulin suppressor-like RCC1 family protein
VARLAKHRVIALSCGASFTACLTDAGLVFMWGSGAAGVLGQGGGDVSSLSVTACHPLPVQVPMVSRVRHISAGSHHVVALGDDGSVWSWGLNTSGQLGHSVHASSVTVPTRVELPLGQCFVQAQAGPSYIALISGLCVLLCMTT